MAQLDKFPNEDTGLRIEGDQGAFRLERTGRPDRHIEGTTIVLCSTEPANYGSFLFRILPKLAALQEADLDAKVMVYANAATYRQLLSLAGIPQSRLLLHDTRIVYKLDHAVVPSLRNPTAFLDEASVAFYAGLRKRFGSERGTRRIYVSRLGVSKTGRVMLNEAEVEAKLEALGFEIVRPQHLTAEEQIKAFSSAQFVIGPSGAAMFNAVFCHPGTTLIDIESEPHWIHAHACLFTSCGLRWGLFEGKVVDPSPDLVHKQFHVNASALAERAQKLLSEME
nr:glycosyltransferase 61 family protein [Limobrevibacterium gyesilva]